MLFHILKSPPQELNLATQIPSELRLLLFLSRLPNQHLFGPGLCQQGCCCISSALQNLPLRLDQVNSLRGHLSLRIICGRLEWCYHAFQTYSPQGDTKTLLKQWDTAVLALNKGPFSEKILCGGCHWGSHLTSELFTSSRDFTNEYCEVFNKYKCPQLLFCLTPSWQSCFSWLSVLKQFKQLDVMVQQNLWYLPQQWATEKLWLAFWWKKHLNTGTLFFFWRECENGELPSFCRYFMEYYQESLSDL